MKYKSIVVTQRGGLEAVQIVENELRPPLEEEVRIRVLATPVGQDDVAVRAGNRPFLKKPPFVPGYACVGVVDAVGSQVSRTAVGDRVAALTQFGSHAEFLYWDAEELVHVPQSLDPAEASTLILNYLVAYQILYRVAQVRRAKRRSSLARAGAWAQPFCSSAGWPDCKCLGWLPPPSTLS